LYFGPTNPFIWHLEYKFPILLKNIFPSDDRGSLYTSNRDGRFRLVTFATLHLFVGDHISCRVPIMYFMVATRIAAFETQKKYGTFDSGFRLMPVPSKEKEAAR